MKLLNVVIFLLFSLTVFHVTGATAENRAGAVSVSPLIGGYIFDSDQLIKNDAAYGIVLGYNITERIGIEGAFNYVDTEVRLSNLSNSVGAYVYRIEGLYHFMVDKDVLPYIAAGAGAISIDVDGVGDDTAFLVNYGAGIKYFLTESLALRAGVRHIIFSEDTHHNILFKFGLSYLIGAKPEEAPPEPIPMDGDGDGVNDAEDQCTGTPLGAVVDSFGCPLDSDRDGVYDYKDTCRGTSEGIKVDTSGCPLPIKEKVSIELNVEFASNSAIVQNEFHEDIEKVSNFLKAYPDAVAVIEGHTDSAGDDQHNLQLSQQRAENVIKHLVDYGIHPSRLKAEGYGESRPIADNSTVEGRQKNRRVVAVISITIERMP
jgi:OOP family OmpA-OmpF porin